MSRLPLARLILLGLAAGAGLAEARSFTVTIDADAPDQLPGDGVCNAFPPELPPACTLRAAIMEANAVPVADEILIPAGMSIVLTSHLPAVTQDLEIGPLGLVFDVAALPVIDGDGQFRQFLVGNDAHLSLNGLRLVDGRNAGFVVTDGGGALAVNAGAQASVERVQFTGNSAFNGGGALLVKGEATVVDSDFNMNEALSLEGGAIEVQPGGSLVLQRSSVRRSRSSTATAEAIHVGEDASLVVVNSMIDGADGQPGATGSGGIRALQPDLLRLDHVTMVNFASDGLRLVTGAGSNGAQSHVRVNNSILADAAGLDCSLTAGGSPNIEFSHVLVEDDSCPQFSGATTISGEAPNLSSQTVDFARFFRYRTPQRPSPAIDAGQADPMAASACLATDMRGTPRPLEGDALGATPRCDLGAIEAPLFSRSTYIVNTGIDVVDGDPGDDVCETSPGSGLCTLRAAVMEANAKPGPDLIAFESDVPEVDLDLPAAAGAEGGDLDITESLVITGQPVHMLDVAVAGDGTSGQTARVRIGQERAGERIFEIVTDEAVSFSRIELAPDGGFGPLVPLSGGAVRIAGGGTVHMGSVDVHANRSDSVGGGVSVIDGHLELSFSDFWSNEAANLGAALFVGASGTAAVRSSSFWANNISDGLPATREAIYVEPGGELSLRNSTVAFNEGGVTAPNPAMLEITQSTLAYNDVRGLHVGFGAPGYDESLTVRSSIFANNGSGGCLIQSPLLAEFLSRNNHNLDDADTDCAVGGTNIVADPGLVVPPAGGGGVVILERPDGQLSRVLRPLHAPDFYDNPALDAVPAGPACLAFDQLGTARPQQLPEMSDGAGACDIGAIEIIAEPRPDAIFADGLED